MCLAHQNDTASSGICQDLVQSAAVANPAIRNSRPVMPSGIPAAMQAFNQWCGYRKEKRSPDDPKPTKVPYRLSGGRWDRAKSNDPSTLSSYQALCDRLDKAAITGLISIRGVETNPATGLPRVITGPLFDGPMFIFTADDPFTAIDLDDCVVDRTTNKLEPWAQSIVDRFANTYWEYSQSGRGLHGIFFGKKPGDRCRSAKKLPGFELYDHGRPWAMTGNRLPGTSAEIANCQQELDKLYVEIFGEPLGNAAPTTAASLSRDPLGPCGIGPDGRYYLDLPTLEELNSVGVFKNTNESLFTPGVPTDDQKILSRARCASDGSAFDRLWMGNSNFSSHSEADFALCCRLVFWCGPDRRRVDSLFRQSGLMRAKWDRSAGEKTYGQLTIMRAIEAQQDHFNWLDVAPAMVIGGSGVTTSTVPLTTTAKSTEPVAGKQYPTQIPISSNTNTRQRRDREKQEKASRLPSYRFRDCVNYANCFHVFQRDRTNSLSYREVGVPCRMLSCPGCRRTWEAIRVAHYHRMLSEHVAGGGKLFHAEVPIQDWGSVQDKFRPEPDRYIAITAEKDVRWAIFTKPVAVRKRSGRNAIDSKEVTLAEAKDLVSLAIKHASGHRPALQSRAWAVPDDRETEMINVPVEAGNGDPVLTEHGTPLMMEIPRWKTLRRVQGVSSYEVTRLLDEAGCDYRIHGSEGGPTMTTSWTVPAEWTEAQAERLIACMADGEHVVLAAEMMAGESAEVEKINQEIENECVGREMCGIFS